MPAISNPKIYNVTCTLGGTEYSQVLSSRLGFFQIQTRNNSDLQLAFISGNSGTLFFTIFGATTHWINGEFSGQFTLYFQSATAGTIVEIYEWSR